MNLNVRDIVSLDDGFGNHWDDGVVTQITRNEVFVRWPDQVIGVFTWRHAEHLKKEGTL